MSEQRGIIMCEGHTPEEGCGGPCGQHEGEESASECRVSEKEEEDKQQHISVDGREKKHDDYHS